MTKIQDRLNELGIELPKLYKPKFSYIPVNQTGKLLYLSGLDCRKNGELIYEGKLSSDLTIEQGQEAARQVIINSLSVLNDYLGDLNDRPLVERSIHRDLTKQNPWSVKLP
ncbi:RidA family protein [bacterium LRH843]|nr:RidA family protein [bacterium LRH843]